MRRAARFAAAALALLAVGVSGVQAQNAPAYPRDATMSGSNGMCLLDGLTLQGATLNEPFQIQQFEYNRCAISSAAGFALSVSLYDPSSQAQLWVNGAPVRTTQTSQVLDRNHPTAAIGTNVLQAGNNRIQLLVNCQVHAESGMDVCQYQYVLNCQLAAGFVTGDPQFVGLRGQNYQVHGVSGEIYNIVSDAELQYNSRFVFLNSGECPVVNGRKQKACWSHPGSYLGELGLKTRAGDKIHLVTGKAAAGFAEVSVNGKALEVGDSVILADSMGSVSLNTTHLASVQIGNWDFAFENSDMFVNQRVRVLDARGLRSHGLLGQTWRDATYPNAVKYIQGSVDDYVVRDNDIFGDSFVFNTHN